MQSICDDQCEIGCFDSTRVVLPLHCIRIASSGAYVNLNPCTSFLLAMPDKSCSVRENVTNRGLASSKFIVKVLQWSDARSHGLSAEQ